MAKIHDIKDGFGDLATDKPVEVDLNGRTLELDMYVEDLHPIMTIGEMQQPTEEEVEKVTDALRTVLYRSYLPYWNQAEDREMEDLSDEQRQENEEAKEFLENLLMSYYPRLLEGIMQDLGWVEDDMMGDGHASVTREDFRAGSQ